MKSPYLRETLRLAFVNTARQLAPYVALGVGIPLAVIVLLWLLRGM